MSTGTGEVQRELKTEEEIEAITTSRGEAIWLINLQNAGEHEFIDAAFTYWKQYHLNDVSTASMILKENLGEFRAKDMTTDLLDKVATIGNDLQTLFTEKACEHWGPDQYGPLALHFTNHHDEWELARSLIREHGIHKFDNLMSIMDNLKHGGSRVLVNGVL